jgi:hypothetical protein
MTFSFVPPTDKDSTMPSVEWASVDAITWTESYGIKTPPPVDEDAPPLKPTAVELPARSYSLLTSILAVGIFIAGVLLFRR